jgi:hypothetical protein
VSFIIRRPTPNSTQTCPGIQDFVRPNIKYVKCHECGGTVEIWSDEEKGVCLDCGAEWLRPEKEASCLGYCEYADKCRGIISVVRSRNARYS